MWISQNIRIYLASTILFITVCSQSPPPYTTDLETQLRNELFSNYSVSQRPADKISTHITLTIFTVNELDIKNQILSLSGYLTLRWVDDRLSWKNKTTDYSNVRFLFATEDEVWRPAVIFENAVDDISVVADDDTPMRIVDTGTISWSPAGIYKVYCQSDITYYPLDRQYCDVKVTGWGYTKSEVKLSFYEQALDMESYSENGEWEIIETSGSKSENKARNGQSFSSLTFSLQLRRRLVFHALNTLFPVALMAFLIPLVFILHVDSGEKIGYSLTVLLAYAVYLTLISENIPSTSTSVCYLSVYLALVLTTAALSVFCTIIVINCRQQQKPIPKWLKKLTIHVLANVTLWRGSWCRQLKCSHHCTRKVQSSDADLRETKEPSHLTKSDINIVECETPAPNNALESNLTWPEVSSILDRFFFIVYMLFVVICTLTLSITIFKHHYSG